MKKLYRPRYISTELNIRKKLFVGILSTPHQKDHFQFASFLNKTITSHADRLVFFVNNVGMNEKLMLESTPPGISVVNFNDAYDYLLPFHSIKYIADKYINEFDWFFLVSDKTYVRTPQVNYCFSFK